MKMPKVNQIVEEVEGMAEINERISHVFRVLNKVSLGIIRGHIRSAIVSGAAGCGKTYSLESAFTKAEAAGTIVFRPVNGAMSAVNLYKLLYECNGENHVLQIDDCDSIYSDLEALNLLKAALDTGKKRMVHWNKESNVLDNDGIPRSFEFKGSVVFITNCDFVREIDRESKMSVHFSALMSRCMYVDMGIHNKNEIFVRMMQVVRSDEFLKNNGLTLTAANEMIKWLHVNLAKVRVLSIRTIIQLVGLVKTDGHWQDMAEVLMLEKRSRPKTW
jgi:hypothetical protein